MTDQKPLAEAIAHHAAGRLDLAKALYRTLLETDADHPEANYGLGVLETESGRFDAGLIHLQRALEQSPETGHYWQAFAEGLFLARRPDEALAVIEQALATGLDTPGARDLQARILKTLAALTSGEADTLLALFDQHRDDEAEILARHWTERAPADAFGWTILGAILARGSRCLEAVSCLEQSLSLNSEDAECLNVLGAALEDLGRLEDAGVCYARAARQALRRRPTSSLRRCSSRITPRCG